MRLLAGAIVSILASCYNPQHVIIACPPSSPLCPEGQVCQGEICVTAQDMGGAADSDMTTPRDFAVTSTSCKAKNGIALGPKAEACPGTFAKGGAASLCDNGYAPCTGSAGIDLALCATLPGIFVADVAAYWVGNMQLGETCNTSINNQLLYGCGTGVSRAGAQKCSGLPRVVDIGSNGWTGGGNGSLADTANSDPSQGVLCCRP